MADETFIIRLWEDTDAKKEGVKTKDVIFCHTAGQFIHELEKIRNRKDHCSFSVYIARLAMEDARFCQ